MTAATFVKRVNSHGEGRVYQLDTPVEYTTNDGLLDTTDTVWVSAIEGGPSNWAPGLLPDHEASTIIMPYGVNADGDETILSFAEIGDALLGAADHEEALRRNGFEPSGYTEDAEVVGTLLADEDDVVKLVSA